MIDDLDILLGTGGDAPGLETYSTISGRCERLLSLSNGQSVYAVAVSPDRKTIAAGTKSGDIYWIASGQPEPQNESESVQHLDHGAPILSMCFVDVSTLAVTDTAGRCLLRPREVDGQPTELPTGRRVICTLFQPDSLHLAGVSLCGRLLIWDVPQTKLVRVLEVPGPPDTLAALIRPVYWKAADAWMWPGRGGTVVFFNWQRNQVHTFCAHTGDVYARMVCDDELLAISQEGTLKRWRAASNEPMGSCQAPKGVVSAAAWGEQQFQMVLVDDCGRAGVYSWGDDHLTFITWLAGQNYRVVLGPDIEHYKAAVRHQRTLQASALAACAKAKIGQRAWDELSSLCQQLTDLGFGHVAWALRGQEAAVKNDMVAELAAYHELFQMVSPERVEARGFLARYADLLESTWHVRAAERLYRCLSEMDPKDDDFAVAAERLSKYVEIFRSGMYVVEPDIPLSLLIGSAIVLNEALVGRFLLKSIEPPFNCQTQVSASELIERYDQLRKTKTQVHLPQAKQAELWYVSKQKADKVTAILFASENPNSAMYLEYGVLFVDAGLQTVMRRMTLFNAGQGDKAASAEQHNRSLRAHLQSVENDPSSHNGWLQMVDQNVTHAIRQLITKRLAQELRDSGGNHE